MANGGTATSATLQVVLKAVDQFTPVIQQARAELARFKATTQQVVATATRPYTQATKQATQAVREQSQILYIVDRYGGITAKTLSQEVAPAQEEVAKKTEDATRAFRRHKQQISELQRFYMMFKNILISMFIYFALRPLLFGLQQLITNYAEQEEALFRLAAVLKSTGFAARATAQELVEFSEALQLQTIYGDEAIQRVEAILLTFTKLKAPILKEATKAVLDMSAALGTDLQTAAIRVGKALQDPIYGVTALRRVGVNLDDQTKELIRTLFKQGKVMEAQRIILDELQTEFGGMAEMLGMTLTGAARKFRNALSDALELVGRGIASTTALNERLWLMAQNLTITNQLLEIYSGRVMNVAQAKAVETVETAFQHIALILNKINPLAYEATQHTATWGTLSGIAESRMSEMDRAIRQTREDFTALVDTTAQLLPILQQGYGLITQISPATGMVEMTWEDLTLALRKAYAEQYLLLQKIQLAGEATAEDKEKLTKLQDKINYLHSKWLDLVDRALSAGDQLTNREKEALYLSIQRLALAFQGLKLLSEQLKIQLNLVDAEDETNLLAEQINAQFQQTLRNIEYSVRGTENLGQAIAELIERLSTTMRIKLVDVKGFQTSWWRALKSAETPWNQCTRMMANSFADLIADAITTGIFEGFHNVQINFETLLRMIMREAISVGVRALFLSAFGIPGAQQGAYVTRPSIVKVAEREPEYIIPLSKMAKFMQPVVYLKIETRDPSTWVQSWDKRTILVLERKLRRGA